MAVIGVSSSAFFSQGTITSVKFGSTCTYVGEDAFKNCISLEEINNDNVIEEIYAGAFAGTKLSSINFSKLKSISGSIVNSNPNGAFQNCLQLTDIDIHSCKNIGMYAFANCVRLENVKFNNTISIESGAFFRCANLKNIDFRNFLKIGVQAFAGCINIENAILNNCNEGIDAYAFAGCTNLKKINLSLCSIGDSAFFGCNNLSEVYINTKKSEKCISLGSYVFYYDKNLNPQQTTYSIISNIRFYLGENIFSKYESDTNWSVYKDYMVKLPGSNQILYTTSNNIIIDIDGDSDYSDSDYYSQYGISSHKYVNNTGSIVFEKNVAELNQKIFQNNTKITSICLPLNCKKVGDYEFEGCENLYTFTPSPLENVFTTIGNCAFKDCTSLKSFMIPESIEELGEGIFAGCKNIEKFEGKFTSYNGKAIVYNNTLINVAPKYNSETDEIYYKISEIDSNITSLGKYCFSGFSKLMRVDITPSYTTTIGDFAFEGCDNLREVHFYGGYPSGEIEFGENAFGIFNENDFKIFVPEGSFYTMFDGIDNIEKSWMKVYKNYIYPEPSNKCIIYYTNTSQDYHLIEINSGEIQKNSFGNNIDKTSISKIIIGEEITKITTDVFKSCKYLEYIYLPNTITSIGDNAFAGCTKIPSITLPSNLTRLGHRCLSTGSSDTKIYIPKSLIEPPKFTIGGRLSEKKSYPFGEENIPHIFVPSDLEDTYKNDEYWGKYIDYIETY